MRELKRHKGRAPGFPFQIELGYEREIGILQEENQ
jgi:hypothetical protein